MNNDLPDDMKEYVPAVEQAAMVTLRVGNYKLAEKLLREVLETVLERQKLDNRRIHKGSLYYNIGFSLVMQNKLFDALRNFLLAYIEDCINSRKNEEEADAFPAARVLIRGFEVKSESLAMIKNLVRENRHSPSVLIMPENILKSFLVKSGMREEDLLQVCIQPPRLDTVQNTLFVNLTSEAATFLNEVVSKRKEEIIQRAAAIALQRGSKIVTGSDVREARKQFGEESR